MNAIITTAATKARKAPGSALQTLMRIDPRKLGPLIVKAYCLQSKLWDAVETILDVCAQQRREVLKKLCRTVRELRRQFISGLYTAKLLDSETLCQGDAERFEEKYGADFTRMRNAIWHEGARLKLDRDDRDLFMAVHEAYAIGKVMKRLACDIDRLFIAAGENMICGEMTALSKEAIAVMKLIPTFIGDCFRPELRGLPESINALHTRIMGTPVTVINQNKTQTT